MEGMRPAGGQHDRRGRAAKPRFKTTAKGGGVPDVEISLNGGQIWIEWPIDAYWNKRTGEYFASGARRPMAKREWERALRGAAWEWCWGCLLSITRELQHGRLSVATWSSTAKALTHYRVLFNVLFIYGYAPQATFGRRLIITSSLPTGKRSDHPPGLYFAVTQEGHEMIDRCAQTHYQYIEFLARNVEAGRFGPGLEFGRFMERVEMLMSSRKEWPESAHRELETQQLQ